MTPNQQAFKAEVEEILLSLHAEGVEFSTASGLPTWRFQIVHEDVRWPLKLETLGWNCEVLPAAYWDNGLPVWGWPHISRDGTICVSDSEGIDYDPEDTGGVCRWVISEALRMLVEYSKMNEAQRAELFADELEGYLLNRGALKVDLDQPFNCEKTIYAEVLYKKIGFNVLPVVRRLNFGTTKFIGCQQERLQHLDISIHQLPSTDSSIDAQWWELFIAGLTDSQRATATSAKYRGLLLRVPNNYGHALLLIHWGRRTRGRPYGTIYLVQRQYREYLIQRTGQSPLERHVIIIGCGAVGARVAEQLVLAGVHKLTLIDHDRFTADNLGRHVLGRAAVGKYKTDALSSALSERVPGVQVISIPKFAKQVVSMNLISEADAIVLATGNAPFERALIRQAYREKWKPIIVSTSVEAGGLGGHAISMRPGEPGCLECLYIDPETQAPSPWMRASLIESGQVVTRQLTGCGAFTPYSALDATHTALLATERALADVPAYARWAGTGVLATTEGIRPSDTYHALRSGRIPSLINPSQYAHEKCSCCSS